MYALKIHILSDLGKRVVRGKDLAFRFFELFLINEFHQRFSGGALELLAKRCSVCSEQKCELVDGDLFEIVIADIADYLVDDKRRFSAVIRIFIIAVLSDQPYEKILEKQP